MALNFVCQDCLGPIPDAYVDSCASCGYVRPQEGWAPDPLLGLILGGRYRLEGRLGAGGMAAVFRASRVGALGGQVAVKVLAPRFSRTVIAKRFEREAQVISRLTNPHIVRVYDFDVFALPGKQQSLYYIAMELIEGVTLTHLLRKQGRVNFLWGLDVLRQTARGLDEAHTQGVVHRDLKPSNIMLIQQRGATHVKVLDFGIAGLAQSDAPAGAERLTEMGVLSGTPDYMAPEQAAGLGGAGPPADIYALGLIAYEMFSGQRPFASGGTIETLLARVQNAAPSLRAAVTDPEFPPEIFRIVDKMLLRDPKLRYQNAGELLDELAPFPTMQTTPDFMPPSELLKQYTAASTLPAHDEAMARTLTSTPLPKKGARAAVRVDGGVAEAPARQRGRAWVWWVIALLVLGGAGAAIAIVVTKSNGNGPGPGDTGTTVQVSDAGAGVDEAEAVGEVVTDIEPEVVNGVEVEAEAVSEVEAEAVSEFEAEAVSEFEAEAVSEFEAEAASEVASEVEVASDVAAASEATITSPVLGHARGPVDAGFKELKLILGRELLLLGVPETLPALFAPLEIRLGLDRAGTPLRLVGAEVRVTLVRSGAAAGSVAATDPAREDGRLALALPARPLADVFAIDLELTIASGEVYRVRVVHDAIQGTFSLGR